MKYTAMSAWRALNQQLANDLKTGQGDIKPARVIEKKANPAKVHIGWMKRRILRGEFRKRR